MNQSQTNQRNLVTKHNVGDYIKVDRFEVIETFKDQEPLYVAISGNQRYPIPHAFSCLVKTAKGILLQKEGFPGIFSNDDTNPYVWLPVKY